MKLQQLLYITAVEQCGTLRKAAQSLFVSEPAVSKSLKELEAEFGITIFERSRTGMTLTRDGEDFMVYARIIAEQHSNIKRRFLQRSSDICQYIKIAVRQPLKAVDALIDTINNIAENDLFNILLYTKNSSEIMDDVSNGSADLGVINILSPFENYWYNLFKEKKLEFTAFGKRENMFIAIDEKHPLATLPRVSISDTAKYPFLDTSVGNANCSISPMLANEVKSMIGMPVNGNVISVHDYNTFISTLKNTNVFAVIPSSRQDTVFEDDGIIYHRIDSDIVFINGVLKNTMRRLSNIEQMFYNSIINLI